MYEDAIIYTSYFANIKKLPKDVIPVAVSLVIPPGYSGAVYSKFVPKPSILTAYKKTGDVNNFTNQYRRDVLASLNPNQVLSELKAFIPEGNPFHIALVCYENPKNFCHRQLISRWFRKYGIKSEEYTRTPED